MKHVLVFVILIIAALGVWYLSGTPQGYTYENASSDHIVVDVPKPGDAIGKTFTVSGKARGTWFFEASFPVVLMDTSGNVLWQGPAQAEGEWMTEDFVPFSVTVTLTSSYTGSATLVLKRDNPSGLPEHDASVSFPIILQ